MTRYANRSCGLARGFPRTCHISIRGEDLLVVIPYVLKSEELELSPLPLFDLYTDFVPASVTPIVSVRLRAAFAVYPVAHDVITHAFVPSPFVPL